MPRIGPVQQHDDPVPEFSSQHSREGIDPAPHQVSKRVAGEGVQAEEDDVDQQDERAQADEEMAMVGEGADDINPEKNDHDDTEQQKIPVIVVQNPGKARLAVIPASLQLLDGARRRIPEERPEIRLSIGVAASSEAEPG